MLALDNLLPEHVVAKRLGVHRSTLRHWRMIGAGPPWILIGARAVRYPEAEVQRYLDARRGFVGGEGQEA